MSDVIEGPVGSASLKVPEDAPVKSPDVDGWPRVEVDADDEERGSR